MRQVVRVLLAGVLTAGTLALGSAAAPVSAEESDKPCQAGKTQYIDDPSAAINLTRLGFPEIWGQATGKGVTVAVIDSGVDDRNAHLTGAVDKGKSFVGGDARDDQFGHGTAVAGIIAARPHPGSVMRGGAPGATILPVRVYVDQPDTALVAQGIRWAAEQGADVINVSISTSPADPDLPELTDAVKYAVRSGAVIVASGGNQGEEAYLSQERYPAALPGVIGVAASNASGTVDNWSIHGPQNDVAAPGESVLITYRDNGDCLGGSDGRAYTSWAAAYVSALAALLREKYPSDSATDISNRILDTAARPEQSKRDDVQGWGVIQPVAALTTSREAAPGTTTVEERTSASASSGVALAEESPDPLRGPRQAMLWWAIAAIGLVGVAIVLRPWIRASLRSRA